MQQTDRSSTSTWQAIQHVIGLGTADIGGWLGAGIASCWFWTAHRARGGSDLVPSERPVEWAVRATHWLGVSGAWATATGSWLGQHAEVSWALIALAVLAASRLAHAGTSALLTVSAISLLGAASAQPPRQTMVLFLALSGAAMLLGYFSDWLGQRQARVTGDRPYASFFASFVRWLNGPGFVFAAFVATPLALIVGVVRSYQVSNSYHHEAGPALAREAERLSGRTLAEVPAGHALRYLAAALLLLEEDGLERRFALRSLLGQITSPPGARHL